MEFRITMPARQEFNEIRDTLKRANIKVTHARIIIFQILKHANKELTAYDIEGASLNNNHRINLATIYSTLKLFQNTGLIQRYKVDVSQALYSLTKSEGAVRIICKCCGFIETLEHDLLNQQINHLCSEKSLDPLSFSLVINVDSCIHCIKTNKSI